MNKSTIDKTIKISDKLFSLMGVDVKINVSEDKENEAVLVNIDAGEATGLLIGNRGETSRVVVGSEVNHNTTSRPQLGGKTNARQPCQALPIALSTTHS